MRRKLVFLLYRFLQALASPVILVYLLVRGLRNPRYFSTVAERCGFLPPSSKQTISASIWFHAVSVGEVLATIRVIEEARKHTPRIPIFLSTATLSGRETAQKRLAGLIDGVFFAPFDFVWAVRHVLRHLRPTVVVIVETEIWPNLFREAKRLGCGLILINGRISDRALPRYRSFGPLFSAILEICDKILVQSPEMQARFELAGAPPSSVEVGGNLKYDFSTAMVPPDSPAREFIAARPDQPLWIAASTSADDRLTEEDFVIAAQRKLPGWRLILAPRKPERFDEVARLLERSGLQWTRRSSADFSPERAVLLLDSIGELSGLFPWATLVFVGGTLADRGGHNILEPAIFGKPVIVGPHMENFREIAHHFEQRDALVHIDSGEQLYEAVLKAVADPGLGERARAAAAEKRGAAKKATAAILKLYDSRYPCERAPQPLQALLDCLSLFWQAGSALDRRAKKMRAARLPVPVVSVGNITAGGTGKTPALIELLREFRNQKAGLLTRGHGRSIRENVILLDEHEQQPVARTGDEAQLCMRAAGAPIAIGADRRVAGTELLETADVRLLFLDDGFQHLQLHRDFDLVLIDTLRPFGGGELLPLGRLREPLNGLARASAFLITRADEAPNVKAIEAVMRRYNATAPIFNARTVACKWKSSDGTESDVERFADLAGSVGAIAFCGLGNPNAFWRTLKQIGIHPLACYEYDDHHQYTPTEIRLLARHAHDVGAAFLLTTAKDQVNLPAEYPAIIGALKLYWLEVRTEIEHAEELFRLIRESVNL